MALRKAELIQTLFKSPCGKGSVLHSQSKNHTVGELSVTECGVECAVDPACAAYSHPPCVLHSEEQSRTCCSHHAANKTFVKQVVNNRNFDFKFVSDYVNSSILVK